MRKSECKFIEKYGQEYCSADHFCAGASNANTCKGDSGSAAVIHSKIAGITSIGSECQKNDSNYFAAYTMVYKYLDWINNIITKDSSGEIP